MRHFVAILFAALVISLAPCRTPPVKTVADQPQDAPAACPQGRDCATDLDRAGTPLHGRGT